jgi:iron-sulfur cluster repair protein YtfE (RIC family)
MPRLQLFDTPHKALRLAFSDLLTLAGKTDFTLVDDINVLRKEMENTFSMVKSHSHHEDDICFSDLDQIVPHATRHDRSEHIRLHHALDALMEKITILLNGVAIGQNKAEAGRSMYTDLCNLHAEMLVHMMEEERDTQPIFWQNMTDEQLASFEPRIMAAMTPEISDLWLRFIIPTQPHAELVGMFRGMKAAAPPFVFEANMQMAQAVMTTAEFEKLAAGVAQ